MHRVIYRAFERRGATVHYNFIQRVERRQCLVACVQASLFSKDINTVQLWRL